MKTLKFNHEYAQLILSGKKTTTWRLYDDKDLSVDDTIKIIDKVDPKDSKTWKIIGQGKVTQVIEKKLADVTKEDMAGHETYASEEEMLETYKKRYGSRVSLDTPVKIIYFDFSPSTGDIPTASML